MASKGVPEKKKRGRSDCIGNVGACPERRIHESAENWSEQRIQGTRSRQLAKLRRVENGNALSSYREQLDLKKRPKRQSSRAGRKGPETVGK